MSEGELKQVSSQDLQMVRQLSVKIFDCLYIPEFVHFLGFFSPFSSSASVYFYLVEGFYVSQFNIQNRRSKMRFKVNNNNYTFIVLLFSLK